MGNYAAYPRYKDSGVKWLGEIPEHWEIKRVKYAFLLQRGDDLSREEMEEGEYPVFGSNGIIGTHIKFTVKAPSITVGRSGSVGEVNYIDKNFWAHNTALYVKQFIKSDPRFIFYLLKTLDIKSLSWGTAVGTLNRNYIHDLINGFPPLDEQKAIAAFLDYKTQQIDRLIAKKEALLEKLDEKRTALISHAVTKGLDPTVPMKDSGIEWLGQIPENWNLMRLKFVVSAIIDSEHKTANYDENGEYLVVRTTNVRDGKLLLKEAKFTNEVTYQEWTVRAKPEKGDILFTREAPAGEACLVPDKPLLCLGQRMVLFKFNKHKHNGYFLLKSLYAGTADEFIKSLSLGSTVSHFNMSDIARIPLFIPPFTEQIQIAEYLDQKTAEIDQQKSKIFKAIDLLKEYRTALITNAVTGKIDVRSVPIPTP